MRMIPKARNRYFGFLLLYLGLYEIFDSYLTVGYTMHVTLVLDYFQTTLSSYYQAVAFGSLGLFFVVITLLLADMIGRKTMIIIVFFGMGLSMFLLSLTQTIEQYGYALFAMFVFFSSDLWVIIIAEEAPPLKRARFSYIISAIGVLGIFLIPLFKVFLTQAANPASWKRMTWFGWLAMPLSLLGLLIKESPAERSRRSAGVQDRKSTLRIHPSMIRDQVRELFIENRWKTSFVFMGIGLLIGLNAASFQTIENYLMHTLATSFPDPEVRKNTIALILTVANVGALSIYIFTGSLADRFGRKPVLLLYSSLFGCSVFALVLAAETSRISMLYVTVFTAQMGYWGLFSLVKLYNAECYPARVRGTAAGLRTIMFAVGMTGGSLFAGLMVSRVPDYIVYLLYAGLFTIGVTCFSLILPETNGLDLGGDNPAALINESV
ncbi:MAG: MFS transporter [Spirochaetia bacterium]|nr:MFS transporter [Spirochaetia bacterium]MCF7940063.1 MFS transporter [Spirochaetia bacterium]